VLCKLSLNKQINCWMAQARCINPVAQLQLGLLLPDVDDGLRALGDADDDNNDKNTVKQNFHIFEVGIFLS